MLLEIRAIKRPASETPVEAKPATSATSKVEAKKKSESAKSPASEAPAEAKQTISATPEVEAKKQSESAKSPASEAPVESKPATSTTPEVEAKKKSKSATQAKNEDKSGSKKKTQPAVESKDGKPEEKTAQPVKPGVVDGSDFKYQAIGSLNGVLLEEDGRYSIEIEGQKFSLFCFKHAKKQAEKLVGQRVWVRCYPQFSNGQLSFSAKSINLDNLNGYIANEFVLRGVWQFIPKSHRPVFTIYRNDLQAQRKLFNQHLPLIGHDEEPFRFQEGTTGSKPKFSQIKARLLPSQGCFEFASQMAEPMNRLPRRVMQKYSPGQNTQK